MYTLFWSVYYGRRKRKLKKKRKIRVKNDLCDKQILMVDFVLEPKKERDRKKLKTKIINIIFFIF